MKAIQITQADKDNNSTYLNNSNVGDIVTFQEGGFPKVWNNTTVNYNSDLEYMRFYIVNQPTLEQYQSYIPLISDDLINDVWEQRIYTMTQEEIDTQIIQQKIDKNEEDKLSLIQSQSGQELEISAQEITDTQDALNNQPLYPMWNDLGIPYVIDNKVQAFDSTDLFLYKCVQAHTSQLDWSPSLTPALWTKIALDGEIPIWVQPTGAQDAYQTGDKVYYPTENDTIYTSLIDANVWNPDSYPAGWEMEVVVDPVSSISEWVQPQSTNPYMKGDKVTYNETTYESTIDNNVWAPNVYGWIAI